MGSVFERVDGMRVSDLIHRAGGLLPNAYQERADLRRVLSDYETYVMIPVNLARALAGDKEADILLQDEDILTVYTIREVQYKPENTVIMYGAVQRPDIYTRTAGMKLSDLLFVSGGLLPGALKDAEITRIDKEGKTVVRTVDVIALAAGDNSQDILLEDGDVVSIRKDNDFLDVLRTVTIEGEVRYPGSYALKHNERLSDLIIRAGGLTDRAFPEASVITRKQEYLALEEQKKSVQQVKELLETLSDQEYYREVAKARLIEERRRGYKLGEQEVMEPYQVEQEIPTSAISGIGAAAAGAITSIPEQTELAVSDIEAITQPQYTLVTPSRKIDSFLPIGRVIVNLNEAIGNPGKKDDIILEDGDKIVIPPKLDIVSISGAVIQPSSLVYVRTIKPKKVKDYIEMVGGYSRDADREAVYVVKANGMVIKGDKATIDAGDMIIVPTKIMTQKITDRWGQVISATKFIVTTLALVVTVKLVLDAIK
jgi:protein involved in polysaccharide export with SLBB domain